MGINLQTKIFSRIEEIPQQDWDNVFPETIENYRFFKALDESALEEFSFFYIMVYDNATPIGAAPCFLMPFPLDMGVQGPFKAVLDAVKKILPNILTMKALVCGHPLGQANIGINGDPATVMKAICDGMERLAKEQDAAILLFKDFNDAYTDTLSLLIHNRFLKIESLPSTGMNLTFSDFEEYLKTLSAATRYDLRRKFKKTDGRVKIDLKITHELQEEELSRIYELYLQTFNKHELGFEKVTKDFFAQVSRHMPQEAHYFLWSIDAKIVAFTFCLVSGERLIDYYTGLDYALAHDYHLYFMRFRDLLNWCIASGIKSYEMGTTSYEPKKRLGFNFIRLYFYIKHRNKLVNSLRNIIGYFVKPDNFDPVFKVMQGENLAQLVEKR